MKKRSSTFSLMYIAAVALWLLPSAARADDEILQARLIRCSIAVCGGFPANIATFSLAKGEVTVAQDGRVKLELERVVLENGSVVANFTFQVFFGSFTTGVFQAGLVGTDGLLGTVTTNDNGDFEGPINPNPKINHAASAWATRS